MIGSELWKRFTENLQTLPNGKYNLDLFLKAFNTVIKVILNFLDFPRNAQDVLQNYFTLAQENSC